MTGKAQVDHRGSSSQAQAQGTMLGLMQGDIDVLQIKF